MTPQQIAGLGVRLFAIWLALNGIKLIFAAPMALAQINMAEAFSLPLGAGILYVVVAAALWFFPMFIAHKLIPKTNHANKLSAPAIDVARVGCCLLGLWLLTIAVPGLFWYFFNAILSAHVGPLFSSMTLEQKLDFADRVLEICIALFLLLRSHVIARAMLRDEKSGLIESDHTTPAD
jgi:hypothetical protein